MLMSPQDTMLLLYPVISKSDIQFLLIQTFSIKVNDVTIKSN